MNNLCVCQYGHSRSVALARFLQGEQMPAVAIGWMTSGDAIQVLGDWADRIFILETYMMDYIPHKFRDKVIIFDVGPDRWSNPYSQDLQTLIINMWKEKYGTLGNTSTNSE